jgi:hypothetical protein
VAGVENESVSVPEDGTGAEATAAIIASSTAPLPIARSAARQQYI